MMRFIQLALILALVLGATGLAVAQEQVLWGRVYQVDNADVYLTLADHTAIRVPMETARFVMRGMHVHPSALEIGALVHVTYEPVYGYQELYISSSSLPTVAAGQSVEEFTAGR